MPPTAAPQKIPPKRVLVVDDEPSVANTIRMVLAISGHKVEIAGDAEGALAVFEAGKYDLVITDLSLPKMDGLALACALKERSAAQPIILLTAFADALKNDGDRLSKIDCLMGKPFTVQQMQEALVKIFTAPA